MNVLQTVPELNAGGVERTTLEVAEALTQAGHRAHVASLGGRMEDDLTALGGQLHRFAVGSKNPLNLRENTRHLVKIIQDHDIDIIHARSRAPAWPSFYAARQTGIPFVTTYHGIYKAHNPLKRHYNSIMARGDAVIANSGYTKAHIIKEHGTDPARITAIPRGVDIAHFDPKRVKKRDATALRESWNIGREDKIILLPGRLTRWKGQITAIQALAQLPKNCTLVLLGDAQGRDAYVQELWRTIHYHELADRVRIQAHTQDMPMALACADCVLSASIEPEAFGRVAAEAQAMQRPVVATAHGGALETVIEGQTGYLVPPEEISAMARAIEACLNWRAYDGAAARQRINAQFSKTALQKATLKVYGDVLN